MSGIRLHPKLGVNPHMTYCPRCGGEGRDLILIGADTGIYRCLACDVRVFGYGHGICPKCGESPGKGRYSRVLERIGEVEEHQKLPGSLCQACEEEVKNHKEIVAAGGVYFRCKACKTEGVIKADAPYAALVRKETGIDAPKPVGVELETCPRCDTHFYD